MCASSNNLVTSTSDEVILSADMCIESVTGCVTDVSTYGCISPATVYCSLMTADVDSTPATDYGNTTE